MKYESSGVRNSPNPYSCVLGRVDIQQKGYRCASGEAGRGLKCGPRREEGRREEKVRDW